MDSLLMQANYFQTNNTLDSAAFYYQQAGRHQRAQGDIPSSDSLFQIGEELLGKIDKTSHLIILKNICKDIYYNQSVQGNFSIQLAYLNRAYLISQRIKQEDPYVLHHLGSLHTRLGDYEKAITLLNKAVDQYSKAVRETQGIELLYNLEDLALSLNDLCIVYASQGVFQKAINKYNEALKTPELPEETIGLIYSGISENHVRLHQYDIALENIKKSIRIYDRLLEAPYTNFRHHILGFQIYAVAGKNLDSTKRSGSS